MERLLRHHAGRTVVRQINNPTARPLCRITVSSLNCARALTDGFRDLKAILGSRVAPSRNVPGASTALLNAAESIDANLKPLCCRFDTAFAGVRPALTSP